MIEMDLEKRWLGLSSWRFVSLLCPVCLFLLVSSLLMGCGAPLAVKAPYSKSSSRILSTKEFAALKANILDPKCLLCHGAASSAPLTNYEEVLGFIEAGDAPSSIFYQVLESGNMPTGGPPLSDTELLWVADWISEGAKEFIDEEATDSEPDPTPKPNVAPTVSLSAMVNITLPTSTATLNASIFDSDGSIEAILWTQLSGARLTIASPNAATTNIAGISAAGDYMFQVTATDDDDGQTSKAVTVRVAAAPAAPVVVPWSKVFSDIIKPKCLSCHGAGTSWGDLSTYDKAKTQVVVGNPEDSFLYQEVAFGRMPKGAPDLTAAQKKLIYDWIKSGAKM